MWFTSMLEKYINNIGYNTHYYNFAEFILAHDINYSL